MAKRDQVEPIILNALREALIVDETDENAACDLDDARPLAAAIFIALRNKGLLRPALPEIEVSARIHDAIRSGSRNPVEGLKLRNCATRIYSGLEKDPTCLL